jgi:hypothetical protein
MGKTGGKTASAVSLGLSLALAVLLVVMTATAEPGPPAPPAHTEPPRDESREPEAARREPGLAAVYLPPPPQVAPPPAPVAEPAVTPPAPPAPPAPEALPEPPLEPAVTETPVPEVVVAAAPPPPIPQTPEPPPPQATPEPSPAPIAITPDSIREGRALLRLLERGEGPDIEIAWPAGAADRADLYRLFSDCFGMRTVIMSAGGEMYGAGAFNSDRYSGFVRQPTGGLSAGERTRVYAIRDRHGVNEGRVLRLFPRRVDAILLGALQRIAGDRFDKGVRIRARYDATANGVRVDDIEVDGRTVSEIIVLPYTARRACR